MHDIGTLPWGIHSVGNAINNLRHITGTASTAIVGRFVAFVWSKTGGMRQIAAISGGTYTAGQAINDSDEVVGFGFDGTGRFIGFYWSRVGGNDAFADARWDPERWFWHQQERSDYGLYHQRGRGLSRRHLG